MLGYHEFSETVRDVYTLTSESFRMHARIVREHWWTRDCISFDDGHISQFSVALPILNQFDLSAVFFITTAWVGVKDSVMAWDHLRELCRLGHTVASHTHTHPMLTMCDDAALRTELIVSRNLLEDRLGCEVRAISLPGGRMNARVLAACGEAGYRSVYTSRVGEYRTGNDTSPEAIGRYIVTRGTSQQTLASYLAGDSRTWRRLQFEANAKRLLKMLIGDLLYQRAWRKAVRSQTYGA